MPLSRRGLFKLVGIIAATPAVPIIGVAPIALPAPAGVAKLVTLGGKLLWSIELEHDAEILNNVWITILTDTEWP